MLQKIQQMILQTDSILKRIPKEERTDDLIDLGKMMTNVTMTDLADLEKMVKGETMTGQVDLEKMMEGHLLRKSYVF